MFSPQAVRSYPADEGGPLALAKEFLIDHNLYLESLTWENTGAAAAFIQIFNIPRKLAVAITDTDKTTGVVTAVAHGFVTGDRLTFSGITGLTTHYVKAASVDTLKVYSTRALALVGGTPNVLPTNDDETGTVTLATDAATAPPFEEYPVLAAASAPSNIGSYTAASFTRGLYVRAVTAAAGSTLISSAAVRFTPRYLSGPQAGSTSYED